MNNVNIAVLVPCYNEAAAIKQVIRDFATALPGAKIYVFDNNSTDGTAEIARNSGAIVQNVRPQGKGNVVRRMFADIEADVYVLVDGDDTYDASASTKMVERLIGENLDMLVGRRETDQTLAYRAGHKFGNKVLTGFVAKIFGRSFTDILSGYRVFSKRFVKSFPALSTGFETETELTVHALELNMPSDEVITKYKSRPEGSESKLNTYRDGFRILFTIFKLFRQERPLIFFSLISGFLALVAFLISIPIFITFIDTGLVPRIPTVMLAASLIVIAVLSGACGLILDTVTRGRQEVKRLIYLQYKSPKNSFE